MARNRERDQEAIEIARTAALSQDVVDQPLVLLESRDPELIVFMRDSAPDRPTRNRPQIF